MVVEKQHHIQEMVVMVVHPDIQDGDTGPVTEEEQVEMVIQQVRLVLITPGTLHHHRAVHPVMTVLYPVLWLYMLQVI